MSRFLLIGFTMFFASCASQPERYLTYEEDQQLKENCEPYGGCVAIPYPMFEEIMKRLRMLKSA